MLFLFFIISLLICFSTLGFGLIGLKLINSNNSNFNLGLCGIFGLFILSIISSFTHIFYPHNFIHNITLFTIGFFIFIYFSTNKIYKIKKDLIVFVFVYSLLFLCLLISKTNEDFPYYHLPNSLQFAQQKLQFGLGNLNHGFKHISSLFLLQSLHYFPEFEHYLFNLTNYAFLVFFILFILIEIYFKSDKNSSLSQLLLIFFLILFLTKFSRIAEYGSDIAGQILVSIFLFFIIEIIFNYKLKTHSKFSYFKISLILIIFAISTKFILSIYSLFIIFAFFLIKNKKTLLKNIFKLEYIIIALFPLIYLFFFNFTSTGCILYPVEVTCFSETFKWSLSSDIVNHLNLHYEVWSKAGKGPNLDIQDHEIYISSLNWLNNWIEYYFFNKVSDYFLVIFLILLIFSSFFRKEIFINKYNNFTTNSKFNLFYLITFLVFFLWFFNFPTLRYAGYIIIYLLFIFPIIFLIYKNFDFSNKKIIKKISIIFLISLAIFYVKNTMRIYNEINIQGDKHHNFRNFPFYWVEKVEYEEIIVDGHKLYKTNGKCWDIPSTCVRAADNLKVFNKNNYIFYSFR